ncbi:hypothetical protein [Halorubrum ezzemoulense]|uniref:Uncharacterized protein n=1 Tax=Halorubrum ezzemoulense TaxID=337243 RepID=A0A256IVA1_HALEZ|nr:hypothetical protein [Halorubrum ezzemoulense]OYR60498.1 hypothetical protein DJ80_15365 [Halorubrum ezzemoulense]
MSDLSSQLVDILGIALILYMFFYFIIELGPLLADSSFGRQFLSSLESIGILFVVFVVVYFVATVYANSQ